MLDSLLPLLVLFVLLGFITLIGHGIWVFLAALARALFGRPGSGPPEDPETPRRWRRCARCARSVAPWQLRCSHCGLKVNNQLPAALAALETTARQLAEFATRGELDRSTLERIQSCLDARRRFLLDLPAEAPALASPPQPVAPPQPAPVEAGVRSSLPAPPPEITELPAARQTPGEEIQEVLPVASSAVRASRGQRQEPSPAAAPPVAEPVAPPKPPRRSLAEVLAVFMEQRNILWGELVGGLLMVGCSIALVISLWHTLEQIPYFPFLIFAGITTALFGAGLYTLHHWKLESTSQGLLVIATLLVPLNFLVMAGLSAQEQDPALSHLLYRIGTEALAGAVFLTLLGRAARVLVPEGRWLLALTIVGMSVSPLLVPRVLTREQPALWSFLVMGAWPVAGYGLGMGEFLRRLARQAPWRERQATNLFAFLGLTTFTLVVGLGFLVYWSLDRNLALERLALLINLAGMPILISGLVLHHQLEKETSLAALRTAGTAVALAGMLILLLALALAWTAPGILLVVCALNCAVLTVLAFRLELPVAHAPALVCLALGYLTAFHLFAGHLSDPAGPGLRQLLGQAESGTALVALVGVLSLAAEGLLRKGQSRHGVWYAAGSGVIALVSLLLVTREGLVRPQWALLAYAIYGASSLVWNLRWRWPLVTYAGLALLVGATLWGLHWQYPAQWPVWALVLAVESLILATVAAWNGRASPWRDTAAGVGILTLAVAWVSPSFPQAALYTYTGPALAATAFLLAWAYRWAPLTWAGSALVLGSLLHALYYPLVSLQLPRPGLVALLGQATLCLLASLVLRTASPKTRSTTAQESPGSLWFRVEEIFTRPLQESALATSFLAVPLLLDPRGSMSALASYTGWLAALWLIVAGTRCWPMLFAAFQAALSVAVLYGVTAWLEGQEWVHNNYPAALGDPRSLQAYGIGLGGLGLLWVAARRTLRSHGVAQRLLEPSWPAVDRVILGLLVLGQFLVAAWGIVPGVLREMTPVGGLPDISTWATVAAHAHGGGAWVLLGSVAVLLGTTLWQRWQEGGELGALLLVLTVPLLVAGTFDPQLATASALRWGLAICFVACSVPGWLALAEPRITARARRFLLAGAVVPALGLTAAIALLGLQGHLPVGPAEDSLFARMGGITSQLVPLALVSAGLLVHGVRLRSAGYVFTVGLIVNLAASLVVGYVHEWAPLSAWWVSLVQANAIASAAGALLWLAARQHFPEQLEGETASGSLLRTQIGLGWFGNLVLLLPALVHLLLKPGDPWPRELAQIGHVGGWLALSLTLTSTCWFGQQTATLRFTPAIAALGIALGILGASTASYWDQGDWLAYHVLTAVWTVTGFAVLMADGIARSIAKDTPAVFEAPRGRVALLLWPYSSPSRWTELLSLAVVGLALRGAWADPARPWWSAAATLAISLLTGCLGLWSRLPVYVYASGLLFNLVGSLLWIAWSPGTATSFAATQVLSLALAGVLWSVVELVLRARTPAVSLRGRLLPFTHVAITVGLCVLGILVVLGVASDVTNAALEMAHVLTWTAWATLVVALVLSLWDAEAEFSFGGLYAAGLLSLGLALHSLHLSPLDHGWTSALLLAGYLLLTTLLQRAVTDWAHLAQALRLPDRPQGWPSAWWEPVQTLVESVVVALSLWLSLGEDILLHRLAGPLAVAVLLPAVVLQVGRVAAGERTALRYATLVLGVVLATEVGWAGLGPEGPARWLHRSVFLMAALALMTVVYGVGLARLLPRSTAWAECARRSGPVLGVLASVLLLVILVQELLLYDFLTRRTPMAWPAVVTVAAALLGLMVAALRFAVVPGRDPLGLSDRGRRLYVYAAELFLALLFVHLRLNVPEWFGGFLARHWALVIMVIAYVGAGLSELFRRRNLPVLAAPLQQTGLFLPLLPLLVFWARPPAVVQALAEQWLPGLLPLLESLDRLPRNLDQHALLWFLLGLLYALVALAQRSFRWALFAALAGNFGLWALLAHHQLGFLIHPQVWLIPLAVIVLTAESLNRDRLAPAQSAALRHLGLSVLYLSSTADMFIAGLGQSVVLPLVLVLMSVGGILAGILLRVRAFLYQGFTFLVLVIFTMIWHAAVDRYQTWVWWVSGIVLGASIIALFAVFEKRRQDVVHVLNEMKKWD